MPYKKVVYLVAAALVLSACRRAPGTDFHLIRFVDLLEAKNIISSPFASGKLDPADPASFHEKNRPVFDRGSGGNPLGLKRKLNLRSQDVNTIAAPPKSRYEFDIELPENGILEFGAGIVRGVNSETVRKRLGAGEGNILFRVKLALYGRDKTIYQRSVEPPPVREKGSLNLVPERVALPVSGGKARISFITEGQEGVFSFWANPVVFSTGRRTRKIIIISIDTLRADHLRCYGYEKETSPNTDALAADGAAFLSNYAPSPWTLPSHVSLLTSLSCFRHGVNQNENRMETAQPTLADVLRTQGFVCTAFTGWGFLSPVFGFSKGFDLYAQGEDSLWQGRAAGSVFSAASRWIDGNRDKDFFLFIHTYQLHNPYIPPPPYDTMFLDPEPLWKMIDVGGYMGGPRGAFKDLTEKERRNIVGLYDGEIRYTDEALVGPLMAQLKSLKIYDETMIILTSDHGEEFHEHGSWEHGRSLYDESLKIPLIIKFPGFKFRGKKPGPFVRLIDVMPTVMDVYGVRDEGFELEGRSLLPVLRGREKKDRTVLAYLAGGILDSGIPEKTAIIRGRSKVILNRPYDAGALSGFLFPPPPFSEVEVYDLAVDPMERANAVSSKVGSAAKLIATMKELQSMARKRTGEKAEIDGDVEEKLRALGYIR